MKASRFNVYRRHGSSTVVYNTLTGRWTALGPIAAHQLRSGNPAALDQADRERAAAVGAIVAAELDEDARFRFIYRGALHDRRRLTAVVGLTFHCNLRCPYCFEEGAPGGRMSEEVLERVILAIQRKADEDGSRELKVMLFGGEPLVEVDKGRTLLARLASWSARRGVGFAATMASNATLATPERVSLLAPHLDSAMVAFDGPARIHDTLRIGPDRAPSYNRVLAGIQVLLEHGVAVIIRVQAQTTGDVTELLDDLRRHGLVGDPRIRFMLTIRQQFFPCTDSCDDQGCTLDPGSEAAREIQRAYPEVLPAQAPAAQILPCVGVGNLWCIAPDGGLYNCIAELGRAERAVGRITEDGRFHTDERLLPWLSRDPQSFPGCGSCSLLPLCGGGCPINARNQHGSFAAAWCGNNREVLESRIDRLLAASLPRR